MLNAAARSRFALVSDLRDAMMIQVQDTQPIGLRLRSGVPDYTVACKSHVYRPIRVSSSLSHV